MSTAGRLSMIIEEMQHFAKLDLYNIPLKGKNKIKIRFAKNILYLAYQLVH